MIRRIIFLFLAILFSFSTRVEATHIIGGEMSVKWISGNDYQITVKIYRDCYNGVPQLDDPIIVSVFDSANVWIEDINIPSPVVSSIPFDSSNMCLDSLPLVCVQQGIYQITHTFLPISGGYILAYQRCCWANSFININNPSSQGMTLTQTIPSNIVVSDNSSPIFNYFPPTVICVNQPFSYDASASDIDGDSLDYRLCAPFQGLSTSNPGPSTATPPPYLNIVYSSPYTVGNPMNGMNSFSINHQTGLLTFTPTLLGDFAIGISCNEFRNSISIGVHYRAMRFKVVQCNAALNCNFSRNPSNDKICAQQLIIFTNHSCGANNFLWNFGDGTTSTSFSTPHIFSAGTFPVSLIAFGSAGNDTTFDTITILPAPLANFNYTINGNTVNFVNTSLGANNFHWDFDDGSTSNSSNPTHTFIPPLNYLVCLIAQNDTSTCTDESCYLISTIGINSHSKPYQIFSSIIGNELIVKSDLLQRENKIRIFNSLGQEIILNEISKTEKQIAFNISSLASGIYFVEITNASEHAVGKFLKE